MQLHFLLEFLLPGLDDSLLSLPLCLSLGIHLCLDLELPDQLTLPLNLLIPAVSLLALLKSMRLRLQLLPVVQVHALVHDLAKTLDLLNSLLVALLNFLHDLQRPVLLTEHTESFVIESVRNGSFVLEGRSSWQRVFGIWLLLDLHAIIGTTGTLDVEGDGTARGLALHAGTILLETDDALERKTLLIYLIKPDRTLWLDRKPRYPCRTTQMYPLVLGGDEAQIGRVGNCLQISLVSLKEEAVILRYLGLPFRWQEV